MTRTQSKAPATTTTTIATLDSVEALIAQHADAAREHLAAEIDQRAEIDRDIAFAIMVTNSGAGR